MLMMTEWQKARETMRSREQIESEIEATHDQMNAFGERLNALYGELNSADEDSDTVECAKKAMQTVKIIEEAGFTQSEAVQLFCTYLIASVLS